MQRILGAFFILLVAAMISGGAGCSKTVTHTITDTIRPAKIFDVSGTYTQIDQMGRPAINTVFEDSLNKQNFNTAAPADMKGIFLNRFVDVLKSFGYTSNILGLTDSAFARVLVQDVLNVSMNGTTTFYDGTNVLTGRGLKDDVITTELTLIFGGADGKANPGLSDDNVSANDVPFSDSFPYLAEPH
jgi:hypothetical protein